jgi:hypothetical protein
MKVQIVRDANGKILASAEVATGKAVPVKVEAQRGQTTEEIDAPSQYIKDVGSFFKTHAKPRKRAQAKR